MQGGVGELAEEEEGRRGKAKEIEREEGQKRRDRDMNNESDKVNKTDTFCMAWKEKRLEMQIKVENLAL